MAFASYRVRRTALRIWKWEADYRGEAEAEGYSLTQGAARWAARGWLRGRGAASALIHAPSADATGVVAKQLERLS